MKRVTAAILIHENKILITRREASDTFAGKWEFPGGKIESGETPEKCLKREMQEELDIRVIVGNFFAESNYKYDKGEINLLAYKATWHSGEIKLSVHDEYKWVTPMELINYDFLPADKPIIEKLVKEKVVSN